jgi:hypothetical protein
MPQDPIRVTNFAWDSQNFPCDAVKAAVGLFGAENTIRHEVEQADAIKQAAATMTATLDSVLRQPQQPGRLDRAARTSFG